jgi:hypothetical protein
LGGTRKGARKSQRQHSKGTGDAHGEHNTRENKPKGGKSVLRFPGTSGAWSWFVWSRAIWGPIYVVGNLGTDGVNGSFMKLKHIKTPVA